MDPPVPTDRELEALKILWQRDRATVREVWRELSRSESELAYTTVLSLLQAMEAKGLVGHEPVGRAYAYFAQVERGSTFRRLAGRFLERVFDGAMDEYLVHALQSRSVTAEELRRLEEALAAARDRSSRSTRRRPGDKP
jgi:predicted transcriptional regulator